MRLIQCKYNSGSVFLIIVHILVHNKPVTLLIVCDIICNVFREHIQILNAFQSIYSQMFCKLYFGFTGVEIRSCKNTFFDKSI